MNLFKQVTFTALCMLCCMMQARHDMRPATQDEQADNHMILSAHTAHKKRKIHRGCCRRRCNYKQGMHCHRYPHKHHEHHHRHHT